MSKYEGFSEKLQLGACLPKLTPLTPLYEGGEAAESVVFDGRRDFVSAQVSK